MRYAFLFPGQGSQAQGMLAEFAQTYSQIKQTFAQASDVLGYDLWQVVQDNPDKLNQTEITQPAMLTAGVAITRVWHSITDSQPHVCAGHSLGEYTALVYAGALDFADAVALVAARGRFMQNAVAAGEGAMAAILGLDDAQVRAVCEQAAQGQIVAAVNFNAVGQVVIAGQSLAVQRAIALAKEAGAKRAVPLAVSVPSHCALMQPAAEQLAKYLAHVKIVPPKIPVLHNVDVQTHDTAEEIKAVLVQQLYNPVRWVDTINAMSVDNVIEMGAGKVLIGLNKRIKKQQPALAVFDPASLEIALTTQRLNQ